MKRMTKPQPSKIASLLKEREVKNYWKRVEEVSARMIASVEVDLAKSREEKRQAKRQMLGLE